MRYQDALASFAYGMLRDWALAEDVVQDAFLIVMKQWKNYETGTSIYAWVKSIVRLKTLETLRSRRRESTVEDTRLETIVEQSLDHFLDEQTAIRQGVLMAHLKECMSRLNSLARKTLHGFYVNGCSYRELAELHQRSLEAVRKDLFRMRKQLRDCALRRLRESVEL
jgi:RNA polymerase sigma-70 factor, ECF subfamily